MDALGVRRPDVLTRVVEYLPEIVSYVQVGGKITDKINPVGNW
jgi:cysteinyl-tRNA synthetase